MPSNRFKLFQRFALCAVGVSAIFALSSSVLADSSPKERTYGPYTIEQLKKPVVLGDQEISVVLDTLAIDTIKSQYVPDISEVGNDDNRPAPYNTDKKINRLRLNISAVCSEETFRKLGISDAIVFDKQGRSLDAYMSSQSATNYPTSVIDYFTSKKNVPDYFGMYLVGVSKADMKKNKVHYGGLVWSVSPIGPAYKAGIRKGDVVTKMGNTAIKTMEGGDKYLGPVNQIMNSDPIPVTVVRLGKTLKMKVKPIEDPIEKGFPSDDDSIWKQLLEALKSPVKEPYCLNIAMGNNLDAVPAGFEPYTISFVVRESK